MPLTRNTARNMEQLHELFSKFSDELRNSLSNDVERLSDKMERDVERLTDKMEQNVKGLSDDMKQLSEKMNNNYKKIADQVSSQNVQLNTLNNQLVAHVQECKERYSSLEQEFEGLKRLLVSKEEVESVSKRVVNEQLELVKESMIDDIKNQVLEREDAILNNLQSLNQDLLITNQCSEVLETNSKSEISEGCRTVTETTSKVQALEDRQNLEDTTLSVYGMGSWEQRIEEIFNKEFKEKVKSSQGTENKSSKSEMTTVQSGKTCRPNRLQGATVFTDVISEIENKSSKSEMTTIQSGKTCRPNRLQDATAFTEVVSEIRFNYVFDERKSKFEVLVWDPGIKFKRSVDSCTQMVSMRNVS